MRLNMCKAAAKQTLFIVSVAFCGSAVALDHNDGKNPYEDITAVEIPSVDTARTIIGQDFTYPSGAPLIKAYAASKSIFGVCLGQQAIGESFGGQLTNLSKVYHGIATPIELTTPSVLFEGLPAKFNVGRYHSWVVDEKNFPADLIVTSKDENGYIMSLEHKTYDVKGVQYHPESVLTPEGSKIINNWLKI